MKLTQQPVVPRARYESVDVLRGVAIFGVLLINLISFHAPPDGAIYLDYVHNTAFDKILGWIIHIFFEGKFYTIFGFLFGLGFYFQFSRNKKGSSFALLQIRRLAVLFFIGILHSIFIWSGDILKLYALLGLPMLLYRNSSL